MSEEYCVEATCVTLSKLQIKTQDYSPTNKDAHITKVDNANNTIEHMLESVDLLLVENLSLRERKLYYLPSNFGERLTNLSRLDLSNNYLENLPLSLSLLKNLKHLYLEFNQFGKLPNVIGTLSNLQSLKACNNQIKEVSNDIRDLVNLKELDLSCNELTSLPSVLAKLYSLENLSLAHNNFTQIPQCISTGLSNLKILDVSGNTNLNIQTPPCSTNLKVFYAKNNGCCLTFPNWILSPIYYKLQVIELDNTTFTKVSLPEKILSLQIRSLSMKQCKLSEKIVDKIITGMVCLEKIVIGNDQTCITNNVFWYMPIQMLKCPHRLKEISICSAGIPAIPDIIGNFVNLKIINLSGNTISWMPEEICTLKNLESLIINNNNLAILPENIGELILLKEFKANCNYLAKLPDSIKRLTKLEYLDLYNNEIHSLPESIQDIPSLLGLDFEYNFFSTENLLIRGVRYEMMKVALREHWSKDNKIPDGSKAELAHNVYTDTDTYFSNSMSSDTSSPEITDVNSDNDLIERWDISEDSSDEFDPTERMDHQIHKQSPFTLYSVPKHTFCPADLHERRVIEKVAKMLQDGSLVWNMNYEEGQFEDP